MLLQQAQNKVFLNECLKCLPDGRSIEVDSVSVKRLKEGRRALMEIQVRILESSGSQSPVILYGKIRYKGVDEKTYQLNSYLFENGFDINSPDFISVPQPVAMIPQVNMSLFLKAGGRSVIDQLSGPDWEYYALQVVRAAYKLNQSSGPVSRCHTIEDELNILDGRMSRLLHTFPQWVDRLLYLKYQYRNITKRLVFMNPVPIHRDFYHDQVLIDGKRLFLLDLDTCSLGDPALDIGNFLGHLLEYAVRHPEFYICYRSIEKIMAGEFLRLYPGRPLESINIYLCLTIIRQILISSQMSERRIFTEGILMESEKQIQQFLKGKQI
jgi:hypothetical protein